jgi:hypothetical protein
MSGLDAVPINSESALDEANKASQLEFFSSPEGKLSKASGSKYSLPEFKAGVPIDKTILENLERMRIEKQAGQGSLANTLLDTLAIFPGDPTLRSQSIASRLGQRQQEEADIANLANTVASGRSAQQKTANINKFLNEVPGGGAAPQGAGAAPGAGAPGALSPAMQMLSTLPPKLQDMGKLLLTTDLPAFFKLVSENSMKRPDMQKNFEYAQTLPPDQQEAYLGQILDKGTGPRSYITPEGKEQRYSPAAGMPGGLAPKAAAPQQAAPIQDAAAWAKANNIPVSPNGGNRTFEGQLDQFVQNPNVAALPGTSPHERGRAIDVPTSAQTPEVLAKLKAAGFQNVGKPWHFELPKTAPTLAAAPAAVKPPPTMTAPAPSGVGTTVEDIARQGKALEASSQSFQANDYKAITERANEAKNIEKLSDQVLANLEGNNFGPGTKLAQSVAEYAQIAGIKLSPKETQKFVDNMGIETARKFLSAAGARQAMGAQFTAVEAADWLKAFAGIDNPKEYIKNFYQVQRAGALVDQDVKNYLLRNKGREQDAYIEWQDSGRKDKIMQENVDSFKNGKLGKVEIPNAKPAAQKPVKRTGMVTDTNNPNYGKQAIEYKDGSIEYKSLENK